MKIEATEYLARVNALRSKMAEENVDLVVGFSNLLEIAIVRYYCGFAPVNESAAIVIPAEGEAVVCTGQASYDYCLVHNALPNSRIAILPEIGEVSGFEYDTEGQLDFEELFKQIKAEHPGVKKIGFIGRLIFPAIIMDKLKKVFADAQVVDFDDIHYEQRIRKSPAEIALLKENWEMVSEMFRNVIPQIKPGMTERHIEGLFMAEMMRLGAESYVQAFSPMVASGPKNSFISMCRNTLRQVQESEIITIGAGVCYEGYNGIICTPLVLGDIIEVSELSIYDADTIYIKLDGADAALMIGKEGYRYKAISYLLFNWVNARYNKGIRLEIAEFLKNQESSMAAYLSGVIERVELIGKAQTKPLDGVLVKIALEQLRDRFPDKYVGIKNSDEGKFIVINDFHKK